MSTPQFVDVSFWQGNINWPEYVKWARQWDGIARVAMRASYGNGFRDTKYAQYRRDALANGIDLIVHYHYSYPQFNAAINEANWFSSQVGAIPSQDIMVLDAEEKVANANATWFLDFLQQVERNYGGRPPELYGSSDYITNRIPSTATAFSRYKLWLANWTFDPTKRPVCPRPWTNYAMLQYTDRASIPGLSGDIDVDLFMLPTGVKTMGIVPKGWTDDPVKKTLTAPNGHTVGLGFREHVLNYQGGWYPPNVPMAAQEHANPIELGSAQGEGDRQFFLYTELGYTHAKGVYEISVGREAYIAMHTVKP